LASWASNGTHFTGESTYHERLILSSDGEIKGNVASAFAWTLGLSILLSWLPFFGPMIAGYVGGRKARQTGSAFAAAIVPAALWSAGLFAVSQQEIKIGGQTIGLGPLAFLAPSTGASIIGGALLGALPRAAKLMGAIVSACGLGYLVFVGNGIKEVVNKVLGSQVKYSAEKNKTCPENLKQLYNALEFYADTWDDRMPPTDKWVTAIKDNVPKDEWLHCPEVSHGKNDKYGYSMNPAMSGKKRSEIGNRSSTPLLYDSTDLAINAHAGPDSLPKPGRHTGKNNILYSDGTVKSQ
jgi:hypothetical protein